jgi:hypothetical protein
LLVAAIGAVVLARRRRGLEDDAEIRQLYIAPRPAYTGTIAEAAGMRHREPEEPVPVAAEETS